MCCKLESKSQVNLKAKQINVGKVHMASGSHKKNYEALDNVEMPNDPLNGHSLPLPKFGQFDTKKLN